MHDMNAAPPQRVYATGMTIALAGVLMFFMALVSAYIVRKGFPDSDWRALPVPHILWLNTLILIASSVTLERARHFLAENRESDFRHFWNVTMILGVFFLAGQAVAWWQLKIMGAYLAANPGASFFYVFTAGHALHLLGGLAALIFIRFRATQVMKRATAVDVAASYWHFMGGLWVFLFLLLEIGN